MKIFWWSNAPWTKTGYGNQTNLFWWRIQKMGHKVILGANYGLSGAPLNVSEHGESTRVMPLGFTVHGNDIIGMHADHVKADIVITLYDAWVFDPHITTSFRWCPWAPVDHDPLSEKLKVALQSAWQPIAYSQFGFDKMKEAGLDPRYVPHGIDTKLFKPKDRAEARKALGLEDEKKIEFLAVMVAANKGTPSRKSFPEVLFVWRDFVKKHPNSVLYLHTHAGPQGSGLDLIQLLNKLDMPASAVRFCDPYWNVLGYPDSYMVNLYNAADVLLNPSQGEGFGLPIVEAQACGTPVIVTNCTSMTELCFSGWMVSGQPFYTPHGAWQFIPSIDEIRHSLDLAYENRGDENVRKRARKGALAYDVELVTQKYWKPVLEEIQAEIESGAGLELVK